MCSMLTHYLFFETQMGNFEQCMLWGLCVYLYSRAWSTNFRAWFIDFVFSFFAILSPNPCSCTQITPSHTSICTASAQMYCCLHRFLASPHIKATSVHCSGILCATTLNWNSQTSRVPGVVLSNEIILFGVSCTGGYFLTSLIHSRCPRPCRNRWQHFFF